MELRKLNKLYETCQEAAMTNEEYFYLLSHAKTEEEKQFYVMMKNHFLKIGMEKVIKSNKF